MIRTLITAVSALALAATANAGEPAQKGAVKFKPEARAAMTPDTVKTREDAAKLGESEFILADADANGSLSEVEFAKLEASLGKPEGAITPAPVSAEVSMFPAVAGEDGEVSKEELAAARVASFDAADADLNRTLSDSERQVFASLIVAPKAQTPKL
jgi:NAD/NADP transhydrogenase alpha subunit